MGQNRTNRRQHLRIYIKHIHRTYNRYKSKSDSFPIQTQWWSESTMLHSQHRQSPCFQLRIEKPRVHHHLLSHSQILILILPLRPVSTIQPSRITTIHSYLHYYSPYFYMSQTQSGITQKQPLLINNWYWQDIDTLRSQNIPGYYQFHQ